MGHKRRHCCERECCRRKCDCCNNCSSCSPRCCNSFGGGNFFGGCNNGILPLIALALIFNRC